MPISVKIPTAKMMTIAINWSFASCSCPSWNLSKDESALRMALASLEDCSSSLHWWLGFWTFLVILGVALEVVFVIWEYVEDLHDFRRGIVRPPDKPSLLLFVLGFLGAGLVAIGVGGELYAESKIARVETCIRKGNDALFLLLSKEAGDAAKSAETAQNDAKAAGESAAKAQAKADRASASAESAKTEASSAHNEAVGAATASEEAQGAALALTARASGHRFNPGLFSMLKKLPPAKVRIWPRIGIDPISAQFANELVLAFKRLGWNAASGASQLALPPEVTIFNKWGDWPVPAGSPDRDLVTPFEVDPGPLAYKLRKQFKDMDEVNVQRLAIMSLALGAEGKQIRGSIVARALLNPDPNSFAITIPDAERK